MPRHALAARAFLDPLGRLSAAGDGPAPSQARARADRDRGGEGPVASATSPTASFSETRASACRSSASVSSAVGCSSAVGGAMTSTISPRGSPVSLRSSRAKVTRSPRRTSSCSLVNSRHNAASRGPSTCRKVGEMALRRRAVRFRTTPGLPECGRVRQYGRAAPSVWAAGSRRTRTDRSGKPALANARQRRRWAPGSAVTGYPASCAARTSLYPGSETSGVPASRYQCDRCAVAEPLQQFRSCRRCVVVVIRGERGGDGVAVEPKLPRHPRVLAGNQVGASQRRERPQRNVSRDCQSASRQYVQSRRGPGPVSKEWPPGV